MIFISAGHHLKDPGAIGVNKRQENNTTIELRNLVVAALKAMGASYITDDDSEDLATYLKRIKSGDGSVVVELHFDAATGKASGTTAIVGDDAQANDKALAKELANATAVTLGIKNRGVISEKDSHRGRLGLMRELGAVSLLEVAFIDNPEDMKLYDLMKGDLAKIIASILVKYDNIIK